MYIPVLAQLADIFILSIVRAATEGRLRIALGVLLLAVIQYPGILTTALINDSLTGCVPSFHLRYDNPSVFRFLPPISNYSSGTLRAKHRPKKFAFVDPGGASVL